MTIGSWILIAVIVVAFISIVFGGRKKKWYKVYLANNDVIPVYRKMSDWWWRDTSGMMGFRLIDGRRLNVSKHWIIKVEEDIVDKEA
jgi:hypothetical protein